MSRAPRMIILRRTGLAARTTWKKSKMWLFTNVFFKNLCETAVCGHSAFMLNKLLLLGGMVNFRGKTFRALMSDRTGGEEAQFLSWPKSFFHYPKLGRRTSPSCLIYKDPKISPPLPHHQTKTCGIVSPLQWDGEMRLAGGGGACLCPLF